MKNKLMLFLALLGIASTAVTQDVNAARRRKKSRSKVSDDPTVSLSKEEISKLVTSANLKKAVAELKAADLKNVDIKGLAKEFLKVRSGSSDAIDKLFSGKTEEQKKDLAQKIFKAYQEAVVFYTENDIHLATSLYDEKAAEMNDKFKKFSAKVEGYDADEIESEYTKLVDQFKKEFASLSDKRKQKFLNSLLELYVSVAPAGQDLKSMKRVTREQDRLLSQIKEYQAGPGELKGVGCALEAIEKNIKKVVASGGISAEDQEKLQKILESYKKAEVQSGGKSANEYLNDVLDALEVDQTKSGNWAQKIKNIFSIAEDDHTPIADILSKIEGKKDIVQYINKDKWKTLKDKIKTEDTLARLLDMVDGKLGAREKNQAKNKLKKVAEQNLSDADLVKTIKNDADLKALFDTARWQAFEDKVPNPTAKGDPQALTTQTVGSQQSNLKGSALKELIGCIKKNASHTQKTHFEELVSKAKGEKGTILDLVNNLEQNNLSNIFRKEAYKNFKIKYNLNNS